MAMGLRPRRAAAAAAAAAAAMAARAAAAAAAAAMAEWAEVRGWDEEELAAFLDRNGLFFVSRWLRFDCSLLPGSYAQRRRVHQ
jgi:hypothetical protein